MKDIFIEITRKVISVNEDRLCINLRVWTGIRYKLDSFFIYENKHKHEFEYEKKYDRIIKKYKILGYINQQKTHIEIKHNITKGQMRLGDK